MDKQLRLDSGKVYTAKEVSAYTGYNANTLRRKCAYYKIEAPLTEGGHRRFTKQNIEMLVAIKEKEDEGWTQGRVDEWLKGEGAPLDIDEHIPKSVEAMELERLRTEVKETMEKVNQYEDAIKLMAKVMDEERALRKKEKEEDRQFFLQALQEQENKFAKHIEKRDQNLMITVREIQQSSKQTASSIEQLTDYQEQMNKKPKTMRDRIAHWFGSSK